MNKERKIRILYILNTTIMGGANISFINMISGLYEKGVEIYIVHPDKIIDETFRKQSEKYVKNYYYVPMRMQVYERSETKIWKRIKNLLKKYLKINRIRLLREVNSISGVISLISPDLIHTNSGVMHGGYFAAKKAGIPHVWHLREYQTEDFGWIISPSMDKFISYLHDSFVITITHDLLDYFKLRDYPKAQCIYNGCFSENDISSIYPKDKYFLCCSRISKEKGQDEVIRAFSIVHKDQKDYRLIIAGFGEEEYIRELKELASDLNCIDAVDFIGYRENIKPLMDNATALIVASRFEGFGRMTAEAAFRGCVVIGKGTGGTKEIIEQIGGYMYGDDVKELVKRMKEVIQLDRDDYCRQMEYANKRAVALFSNEQAVKNIFLMYNEILTKC